MHSGPTHHQKKAGPFSQAIEFAFVCGGGLFFVAMAFGLSVWVVLGALIGKYSYEYIRKHHQDLHEKGAFWAGVVICAGTIWMSREWYWEMSPLASAEKKCEQLEQLWREGRRDQIMNVVQDLADNVQEWEESPWDY